MSSATRYPVLYLGRSGPIYGLSRQMLYLASGLDQQRFPLRVVINEPGPLQDELAARNIECLVQRMSPWRALFYVIPRYLDARRLLALARERRCRLVHAQDVWRAEYAYYIAKHLGIPSVVHVRGPLTRRDIHKHRLFRADAIIAVAQRYVDDLVAAGIPSERITLIDDAVDLNLFSAAAYPRQAPADGIVRVAIVGRISPEKRILEFLEVIALLPPQILALARFQIVGDWVDLSYRHEVEAALDRLQLRKIVHFPGGFDNRSMPRQLSELDLLVTLAGGSVMFEAMAMGAAVLSVRSDHRHSRHTRHDQTAWCVTTDRPEQIGEALSLLLTDADLRLRIAKAGQDWVGKHLCVSAMTESTRASYERLLGLV